MGLRKRMAKQRIPEDARRRMGKTLQVKRETSLDVDGRRVGFCEYEDAPEGDFVKICSDDLDAWYAAEDAWFAAKYPGAVRTSQQFASMKLNGTSVRCDILTLALPGGGTRNVYFDISLMMADLGAKIMDGTMEKMENGEKNLTPEQGE